MLEFSVYYDHSYWFMNSIVWKKINSKDPVWCFTHPYEYRLEWMYNLTIKMCMIALDMIYYGRY